MGPSVQELTYEQTHSNLQVKSLGAQPMIENMKECMDSKFTLTIAQECSVISEI
jgi:hypothetical protein